LDPDQVGHRRDHAADLGTVLTHDALADPAQAERAQGLALVVLAADGGLGLRDLQLCHHAPTFPASACFSSRALASPSARLRSMTAGATRSTGRPRRAATDSGSSSLRSASTVACTMLIAFSEPSDLVSTSWIPAQSRTARTGPPAMTPVPGAAGRRKTPPAAASPGTVCGMVLWMRGTRKKFSFASSTPFAMAAGTSLALPQPTPTVPSPSPTTTRAVKLKRRPPLTTLATRLIATTRSRCGVLSADALPRPPSRRLSRRPPSLPPDPPPRRC